MTCRSCGTEIAEKAIVCYRCGAPTAEPAVNRPAPQPWADSWPIRFVVFGILFLPSIVFAGFWFREIHNTVHLTWGEIAIDAGVDVLTTVFFYRWLQRRRRR